jgi:hypothetical protein
MVGTGNDLIPRVENLDERIVVALIDLDQVCAARNDENMGCRGLRSEGS